MARLPCALVLGCGLVKQMEQSEKELRMIKTIRTLSGVFVVAMLAAALLSAGCRGKARVAGGSATITTTTEQTSSFDTAVDFLNNLDQYRPATVLEQIGTNLGDWARQEKPSVDWLADPMVNDLPEQLRPSDAELSVTAFERPDAIDLQEAVWLRDVARTVSAQPIVDTTVEAWLQNARDTGQLTNSQAADLSLVYRLFDWTVRNTQLDAWDDPDDVLPSPSGTNETLRHRYAPWECLLYGHADWVERARLHILLCRQLGIDCVLLSADRGADEPEQLWCVGAWIGEQLFLFDPLLGLALPGQGGAPLATLGEYVQNPRLLDRLVAGSTPYRIATSDLQQIVAWIDASPSALSQRMKQIESRLTGQEKMVLTSTPTPLARALRKSEYLHGGAKIWLEPYHALEFARQFSRDPSKAPKLTERLQQEQMPFVLRSSLMQGRLLQLRGKYRGDSTNPADLGANKLYMNSRLPKRELDRFSIPLDELREQDPKSPMLDGLPADDAEAQTVYEQRVAMAFKSAVWMKDNASLWLAMIAFDKGEFDVARNHLVRLLEDPESKWLQSARYNLGRALEAMAQKTGDPALLEQAIEAYQADESSPQHAGNQVRAALLKPAAP